MKVLAKIKKFFNDRRVKKVREENRWLAVMAQQRHEIDLANGATIVIKGINVGDVAIWTVEDGIL
jgi:hypothetical protein